MGDRRDGGPAFPAVLEDNLRKTTFRGMTLRDWFAGQALNGILGTTEGGSRFLAEAAYELADAMLEARDADR